MSFPMLTEATTLWTSPFLHTVIR